MPKKLIYLDNVRYVWKKIKIEMDKYQHQISQEGEQKFDVKFTQIVC